MTRMTVGPKWSRYHWAWAGKGGSECKAGAPPPQSLVRVCRRINRGGRGLKPVSASPTQPHPQPPASTLASPHSKHGLRLLPDAVQVHVGGCGEQEGTDEGKWLVHVQERWGALGRGGRETPKPPPSPHWLVGSPSA